MANGAGESLARACASWPVLVFCLFRLRDQELWKGAVVHGKEKVYGLIP
jgi:hypothetical protein